MDVRPPFTCEAAFGHRFCKPAAANRRIQPDSELEEFSPRHSARRVLIQAGFAVYGSDETLIALMEPNASVSPCPVCGAVNAATLDSFPVPDLRKIYLKQLNVDIQQEFPRGLRDLRLKQCENCGLQFFDPLCSGSPEFYAQLAGRENEYYSRSSE